MGKGEETRLAVLQQAVDVARRVGLSGLTIGRLAEQTALSMSGLFGHFRSKEELQLQVLEHARTGAAELNLGVAIVAAQHRHLTGDWRAGASLRASLSERDLEHLESLCRIAPRGK